MALVTGAQGAYTDLTGVVDVTAAAEVIVEIARLEALISPADGIEPSHPDFFHIEKHIAEKLQDELTALKAAIAAAPAA